MVGVCHRSGFRVNQTPLNPKCHADATPDHGLFLSNDVANFPFSGPDLDLARTFLIDLDLISTTNAKRKFSLGIEITRVAIARERFVYRPVSRKPAYSYTRSRISHQQRVHSFQGASSLFAFRDPSKKPVIRVSENKKRLCSLNKHTKMLHFANFVSFSSASDRPLLFTKTNSSAYCYYQSRANQQKAKTCRQLMRQNKIRDENKARAHKNEKENISLITLSVILRALQPR